MAKRSCDFCVQRKTRCDNGHPCRKCVDAKPPLECTYLKPVLKRGPKTSKLTQRCPWQWAPRDGVPKQSSPGPHAEPRSPIGDGVDPITRYMRTRRLPFSALSPIIEAYRGRMYPVWPVIDASAFLTRIQSLDLSKEPDVDLYIMTIALCAATTAQLNMTVLENCPPYVNSAFMERQCSQLRALSNYREHPSLEGILTSFFLHVYHAKTDNRNASMVFLQEAISLARLLRLDRLELETFQPDEDFLTGTWSNMSQKRLVYLLLWISERGYAIQHDFPISIPDTIIPPPDLDDFDLYGRGLIELASLFIAFDRSFYGTSRCSNSQPLSEKGHLIAVQDSLEKNIPRPTDYDMVQRADYNVTKHWMRILIWQQAMNRGLLSSAAEADALTFLFPSRIAREFLVALTGSSKDHLASLGRDQLVKSFEITNTLADVVLCTSGPSGSSSPQASTQDPFSPPISSRILEERESWRYGPPDYLHALYQNISPFFSSDKKLNELLRLKAAEALLSVPGRAVPKSIGEDMESVAMQDGSEEEDMPYGSPLELLCA